MIFSEFKNIDKLFHFITGAIIAVLLLSLRINQTITILVVLLIALAKEIYDSKNENHTPDFMDFIVTIVGCITALMIFHF